MLCVQPSQHWTFLCYNAKTTRCDFSCACNAICSIACAWNIAPCSHEKFSCKFREKIVVQTCNKTDLILFCCGVLQHIFVLHVMFFRYCSVATLCSKFSWCKNFREKQSRKKIAYVYQIVVIRCNFRIVQFNEFAKLRIFLKMLRFSWRHGDPNLKSIFRIWDYLPPF